MKNVGFLGNETFKDKQRCCGCSSCKQLCPKHCIEMVYDSEGFFYPVVDNTKCIKCGICIKNCPLINNHNEINKSFINSYIGLYKNERIRINSSSGGIFYPLAKHVIERGGVVFGAAFDDNWNVHHVCVTKIEELKKIMGSKYVQSNIGDTFIECKKYLDKNVLVLFSGVACQIEALKIFLKKDYDNLISVDVLCHGVPSPKVWQMYLSYIRRNNNDKSITTIEFRNKTLGWSDYGMSIEFDDNSIFFEKHYNNLYSKYFLQNIGLRPSCHNCHFKSLSRSSDITLGDAWGIDNYNKSFNDEKGTSVILIHTNKGMNILNDISDYLNLKEYPVDTILPPMSDSRKSVSINKKRNNFFKTLNKKNNFESIIKHLKQPLIYKILRKIKHIFINNK